MFLPIISDNIFCAKNKILNQKLRKITYLSVKKSFERDPYVFNFLKSSEKDKKDLIKLLISYDDIEYVFVFFDGILLNTTSSYFIKNNFPKFLSEKPNTGLYAKIIYDPFNCLEKISKEKIKYPIYPWIWPQELLIRKDLFVKFLKYNIKRNNLLFSDKKINFNFVNEHFDFSYKVKKLIKKESKDEIIYNQYIFSHLIHFVLENNYICERTNEDFSFYLSYCYKSAAKEEEILDFLENPNETKIIENKDHGYHKFQSMYGEIMQSNVCYPYNTSYFYRDGQMEEKEKKFLQKYDIAFLYTPVSGFFSEILFKYYSQFIKIEKIFCYDFFEESLKIKQEIYKNLKSLTSMTDYEKLYDSVFYGYYEKNKFLKKISKEKYQYYKNNIFKYNIIANEQEVFEIMKNVQNKINFIKIDVVEEKDKFVNVLCKDAKQCNILYFSDIFSYLPLNIKNENLNEIYHFYNSIQNSLFVGSKNIKIF